MIIQQPISTKPGHEPNWHKRWEGPDKGLICAWLQGIEKAIEEPTLSQRALNGELPVTAFRGGIVKALKNRSVIKIGSLHYLAYWQGLRGDDLYINLLSEPQLTCSRTGMTFSYTSDISKLLAPIADDGDDQ